MICPCCGQTVTPPGRLQALMPELGPVSGALLRVLMAADRPLSQRELAERVYAGAVDGGPSAAEQVIAVTARRLRRQIEPLGWTIRSAPWLGYRLAPVAV